MQGIPSDVLGHTPTGHPRERFEDAPTLRSSGDANVALAHDYLLCLRGAERVFATLADIWPDAPIHTTVYDVEATERRFKGHAIMTSPLQRLDVRQDGFRRLLPLYPWAVGRLEVGEVDALVSSSSAFAHGIRVPEETAHVCYCHSPFRYAWHEREQALAELPAVARPALAGALGMVRRWDRRRAAEVTRYVANSGVTQARIREVYGIDAELVYPPVDVGRFRLGEPEDHVLIVGELVAHKRVDRALRAARRAGRSVRVVGTGPELERLRTEFPEVVFLGRIDDDALTAEYGRCAALLVPTIEEFGITAVEAQAAGRPVLAARAGGTGETVIDGVTGILLDELSEDTLADALGFADFTRFSSTECIAQAHRFGIARFQARMDAIVADTLGLRTVPAIDLGDIAAPVVAAAA